MTNESLCCLCGLPMPPGEEMFNYHGYSGPCPQKPAEMTPEEADAAYNSAPPIPISDDEVNRLVENVVTTTAQEWEGPKTIKEAQLFDAGFKSGLTVYARETGASTLKSDNPLLARLMDEQSWRTIETFERLSDKGA